MDNSAEKLGTTGEPQQQLDQQGGIAASQGAGEEDFPEVQIESFKKGRVPRRILIDKELDECQMTEACVVELGFDLVEESSSKKITHLTLALGPKAQQRCVIRRFRVVSAARHSIMVDDATAEALHSCDLGGNAIVHCAPVSKNTRRQREQERENRLAQERQAEEEAMKRALVQGQEAVSTANVAPTAPTAPTARL